MPTEVPTSSMFISSTGNSFNLVKTLMTGKEFSFGNGLGK
jgi:hypothetical protein